MDIINLFKQKLIYLHESVKFYMKAKMNLAFLKTTWMFKIKRELPLLKIVVGDQRRRLKKDSSR